jgi:hypothetical protein
MVQGERGLQRYQVPLVISRDQSQQVLRQFLKSHSAIAMDAGAKSSLSEAFVAYLPFWSNWTRAMGWVLGQKRVRSGKSTTLKPREVKVAAEMNWNGAACDVGEFGVQQVTLTNQPLQSFDPDELHRRGLVFEPTSSVSQARATAEREFEQRLRKIANLDVIGQVFARYIRQRMGLVYYPLWVMRYAYRGRSFQVAIDGFSGQVLYGKAPGNTLYRAAVLVGGMALGAFLMVDVSALAGYLVTQVDDGDAATFLIAVAGGAILLGIGLMAGAYRAFRYGEQYEYRQGTRKNPLAVIDKDAILSRIEEASKWLEE